MISKQAISAGLQRTFLISESSLHGPFSFEALVVPIPRITFPSTNHFRFVLCTCRMMQSVARCGALSNLPLFQYAIIPAVLLYRPNNWANCPTSLFHWDRVRTIVLTRYATTQPPWWPAANCRSRSICVRLPTAVPTVLVLFVRTSFVSIFGCRFAGGQSTCV